MVAGLYMMRGRGDPGRVVQPLDVRNLRVLGQRDDHAGGSGPGRATGAVQVVLVIVWRIEVNDKLDVVHVDPAGGDVGGDEHPRASRGEAGQGPLPLGLGQRAVVRRGGGGRAGGAAGAGERV